MTIGINVWISMECPWQDAFTTVKIMLIAKMIVSLSSKAALPIAPVRFVKLRLIPNESYQMTHLLTKMLSRRTVPVDVHATPTNVKMSIQQ